MDHRVDLAFDVVRLVDHEGYVARRVRRGDLAHDPEELERVDRTDDQVVVCVLAVIEVEAPEQSFGQQERDDLLDVRTLRVVPSVDENPRLIAETTANESRRSPVGNVGAVQTRLEKLVFDEESHAGRKGCVELFK